MPIKILNPAHGAARYVSQRNAERMVRHNRAVWSGKHLKLIAGHRRAEGGRWPMCMSPATNRGIDTRGRAPLYDTPAKVWGLRPTA